MTQRKVYVAAPFIQWGRARDAIKKLADGGLAVTYDWTKVAEQFTAKDGTPRTSLPDYSVQDHREQAMHDLNGVRDADYVLALSPSDKALGCGMWFEAGMALAFKRRLIVTGEQCMRTVFCHLAHFTHRNDADGIEWILRDAATWDLLDAAYQRGFNDGNSVLRQDTGIEKTLNTADATGAALSPMWGSFCCPACLAWCSLMATAYKGTKALEALK